MTNSAADPFTSLLPPQQEVLTSGLLTSGFNCLLHMPTGAGKTWLAEQAIAHTIEKGRRAIYLTPLRALATELMARWQSRFAHARVGVFTGDYGKPGKPYPVSFKDAQLLIMTPERLDACTRTWRSHWSWLPETDLLVVDEFHLLGDAQRGARLEGTLSRCRRLNPFLRVLGLSATMGNLHELADWLEGVEYASSWRPIPIEWQVVRFKRADEKPSLLAQTLQPTVQSSGQSLVFVQSRRRAEELSRYLQEQGYRTQHHHAGLPHAQRQQVEQAFRRSSIDVLVATATLEMGLNLPVRQVVLYDLQRFDGTDFQALSTNSVWQRVGRAGRPGLDEQGQAVLMAPTWDRQADGYPKGHFEPIASNLADPRHLAEQIIAEVASGLARSPAQLQSVFAQSLANRQQRLPNVSTLIDQMEQAQMIRPDEEHPSKGRRFKATRLGYIAVRHMLSPSTLLLFRSVLDAEPDLTFFDVLLLASCSTDAKPVLPVDFEELDALAADLSHEPSFLLQKDVGALLDMLGISGKRLLAALKMAQVARDWTRASDKEQAADRRDCYPFEVERLCESLERLLLAMGAILEKHEIPAEALVPLKERIETLHTMIGAGIDETTVTLTCVPGIGPKTALRLKHIGIDDIEALALADVDDLDGIASVSKKRLAEWITQAEALVPAYSATRYREDAPTLHLATSAWPDGFDPYRLRRALDLTVQKKGHHYIVTGGLEPHRVAIHNRQLCCDCMDAQRGHRCKHVLAIGLSKKDRTLEHAARQLQTHATDTQLDLFALWFSNTSHTHKRRA